jgi:hypothetical protein
MRAEPRLACIGPPANGYKPEPGGDNVWVPPKLPTHAPAGVSVRVGSRGYRRIPRRGHERYSFLERLLSPPPGMSVLTASRGYRRIRPVGPPSSIVAIKTFPAPPGFTGLQNNGHLAYGASPLARLALFCGGRVLVFFSLPNSHLFPAPTSNASQPQKKALVTVASIGYSWVEWKWRAGNHVLPGWLVPLPVLRSRVS